jgi:DNA-binding NarL/FixJ family response regulator
MTDNPIRLLLVDDHQSFLGPASFMLDREPDLEVTGRAGSLAEAYRVLAALTKAIDVALIDLNLPDGSGVDLIRDLHVRSPEAQVIVLTGSVAAREHAFAIEAGAAAVLHKSVEIAEIASAIRRLAAGEPLMSPRETIEILRLAGRLRAQDQAARSALERLTEREREVLRALADGLSDKEIAARLGVSPKTARGHVVNLLGKLGVESRLQAVVLAVRLGAVELD